VFTIPDPDEYLSASDVKDVSEDYAIPVAPGVEGSLDPGDIWLVVILACTNQNSFGTPATIPRERRVTTLS